jgi:hypothetical protein
MAGLSARSVKLKLVGSARFELATNGLKVDVSGCFYWQRSPPSPVETRQHSPKFAVFPTVLLCGHF